jgi:hypothetical protein
MYVSGRNFGVIALRPHIGHPAGDVDFFADLELQLCSRGMRVWVDCEWESTDPIGMKNERQGN